MKVKVAQKTPPYFEKPLSLESAYMLLFWGFFMALAIYILYVQGFIHSQPYPKNTFLPAPVTRFGDFYGTFNGYVEAKGLGGVGYGLAYFPAVYIPIQFLQYITTNIVHALWISQAIWGIGGSVAIFRTLRPKGFLISSTAFVLIMMSYPSLFTFHTANIEGWIALILLIAASFAVNGSWLGFGILIGAAGAFKGVPFIFLLIPWFTCKWRLALRTTIASTTTAVALTLAALIALPGGLMSSGLSGVHHAISAIQKSQEMYTTLMVNGAAGIHYGHSLLNSVHAFWGMGTWPSPTWGPILFILMMCLLLLALIQLRRSESPLWMNLAVVGSFGCLAPATSTDYKLLYLAPAVLIFLKSTDHISGFGTIPIYIIIFAMSSKPWWYVGTDPFGNATVYLTTAALIAIPIACIAVSAQPAKGVKKNSKAR